MIPGVKRREVMMSRCSFSTPTASANRRGYASVAGGGNFGGNVRVARLRRALVFGFANHEPRNERFIRFVSGRREIREYRQSQSRRAGVDGRRDDRAG